MSVAVDMDTVDVLDAQQAGALRYVLLRVNGPSKRKEFGRGECGAGYETAIVWLKLQGWQLQQVRSYLVESCWLNRIMESELLWEGRAGVLPFQQMGKGAARYELHYDRGRPRIGFAVEAARS